MPCGGTQREDEASLDVFDTARGADRAGRRLSVLDGYMERSEVRRRHEAR